MYFLILAIILHQGFSWQSSSTVLVAKTTCSYPPTCVVLQYHSRILLVIKTWHQLSCQPLLLLLQTTSIYPTLQSMMLSCNRFITSPLSKCDIPSPYSSPGFTAPLIYQYLQTTNIPTPPTFSPCCPFGFPSSPLALIGLHLTVLSFFGEPFAPNGTLGASIWVLFACYPSLEFRESSKGPVKCPKHTTV